MVAALALAGAAFYWRGRATREKRWREGLREEWEEPLRAVAVGDLAPADLRERVPAGTEMEMVEMALEYLTRLEGEEAERLRESVRPLLGRVEELLDDRAAVVRASAVRILGEVGDLTKGAGDRLRKVLNDRSELVAFSAARQLLSSSQAVEEVLDQVDRFRLINRRSLASALAGAGTAIVEPLRRLLADPERDDDTRMVAAEALRMIGDLAAADLAAKVVREEGASRDLRSASLRLLGEYGRPEHRPVVREAAEDDDGVIRLQAVSALATLGEKEDAPLLLRMVENDTAWVARRAAECLLAVGRADVLGEVAESSGSRALLAEEILARSGARPGGTEGGR